MTKDEKPRQPLFVIGLLFPRVNIFRGRPAPFIVGSYCCVTNDFLYSNGIRIIV